MAVAKIMPTLFSRLLTLTCPCSPQRGLILVIENLSVRALPRDGGVMLRQ